jgi:hypothetical protein
MRDNRLSGQSVATNANKICGWEVRIPQKSITTGFQAVILLGLFDPEDGGDVPPKRWLTFNELHGVISQKTVRFNDNWLLFKIKYHVSGKISTGVREF